MYVTIGIGHQYFCFRRNIGCITLKLIYIQYAEFNLQCKSIPNRSFFVMKTTSLLVTGAVHETGHALYEQGRNLKYDGLLVNSALSMGVHESQSLFWERMIALSPSFAAYLLPRAQAAFPEFGVGKTPAVRLCVARLGTSAFQQSSSSSFSLPLEHQIQFYWSMVVCLMLSLA